ncbi:MAG: methionyl-tRNA formyltransferase [Chloroflexi bacterium]|nr:methionyl-tRNA formyltransferase [Chloroflexota bacterium]
MKLVFFGSPQFATPSLASLAAAGHEICAVVTQPDRRRGRSKEPLPTPVAAYALSAGLTVWKPEQLRDQGSVAKLAGMEADAYVVVAYGKFLPDDVLVLPRMGVLNLHPSLIPKHRGPSPVATAILEGDEWTGVTIMLLDSGMDTGPVLAQSDPEPITGRDSLESVTERLFEIGAALLPPTLQAYAKGEITPAAQDNSRATTSRLLKRQDGRIDWNMPAIEIHRQIRAFDPWPGTFTTWNGQNLKILSALIGPEDPLAPGEVIGGRGVIYIGTGDGQLEVQQLQLEGKAAATSETFLRGYPDIEGAVLDA